ncbi:uncharacterized protein LOC129182802 isoform X2 [Dunckerocampus dactyliophorus]|uniref:uncharacterized protein LOC129182802 isoform X2 n=1 Tax=Dunckerocampus dactyliophorus TaxID=161453 RepID=UPI002404FAFE|nr:uncharacterized protein LOC129182802 isoform X2 [Dunckerocampus dactyliophorus]
MFCNERRNKSALFLFLLTINVFHLCGSIPPASWRGSIVPHGNQESASTVRELVKQYSHQGFLDSQLAKGRKLRESEASYMKHLFKSEDHEPVDQSIVPWTWTNGKVTTQQRVANIEDGYQGHVTGSRGVYGKALLPSSDSFPHVSDWLAMNPVLMCYHDVMTFTAYRKGFTQLFVDTGGAYPISLLQLPPYCGYTVRTSRNDLQMIVPYDACYITQENGSYVLPMLWRNSPLKLTCPAQIPASLIPDVLCSHYGMAVQLYQQEKDLPMLGVLVNGGWAQFVSAQCAYRVDSQLENLIFFISFIAPCVTIGDGLQLQLVFDRQEMILSCPVPSTASRSPPGGTRHMPGTGSPSPQSPSPPSPVQEPIASLPDYLHTTYREFLYTKFPQFYSPGPEPASPPSLSPGSLPGATSPHQIHNPSNVLPAASGASFEDQIAKPDYLHIVKPGFPYPIFSHVSPPGFQPASPQPTSPQVPHQPKLQDYLQTPFYVIPTAPSMQGQAAPPSSRLFHPPKHPSGPHDQLPSNSYGIYHPYEQLFDPKEANDIRPPPMSYPNIVRPPAATPTQKPAIPSYLFPQAPLYFLPPPHSEHLHPTCPPYAETLCGYYQHSDPYSFPSYLPVHPPVPHFPTESPATTQKPVLPSPSKRTPLPPHYHCEVGSVVVFLPTAHPHLIQVKDQETWQSLSTVCGHKIHMPTISTVILYSPLPGCYTMLLSPTVVSMSVRYLDLSSKRYHTVDLKCPYQSTTPTPVTPSTPPAQFGKTQINPTAVVKPKVFCSSKQMLVKLPPGPISGIVLKDAQGNETSVQDASQHCGYSANIGKDGKIHLRLPLHTSCQMSMQDNMYIITVAYMTQSGQKGAQFYCPVSNSLAGQECTIDRHFVFSVPASLTEPPLSPSLLVVANNSTCKPVKATSEYALFKLPMDGCGARRMEMGKSLIYMVEVVNMVQTISLNYGTITRDSPVRLLVECRYLPGSVLTVSYLVKTPTLAPTVQTQGVFGVQLRLAKDAQYTSYYPQYHQPLQMLLGKPLYLEVRMLNAPDPNLVLLVHYCVAYPRSGEAVWVLLYNGCPNPLDPASQQVVLSHPEPPSPQGQIRRFTMSTFQFLPDHEIKDPDEEIYFMCSTEVCSPHDGPCVEGCFGH